jgi:hypothetical protein
MHRHVIATLLVVGVALGVIAPASAAERRTSAAPAAAAAAARPAAAPAVRGSRPPASYFGMHYGPIGQPGLFPDSSAIGTVRLWDTGTTWHQLQPRKGNSWRWDTLDTAVTNALAHNSSVLYVLGSAPRWAAKYGKAGYNHASPPRSDKQWVAYVRAVATRYKGRIRAYEVWNEANLDSFWDGSTPRLVRLASLAYRTIKKVDRRAIVTSPSITLRGGNGKRWMPVYARLGGLRFADVINVHMYPEASAAPEESIVLLERFRAAMRRVPGGRKPIWNTEINYGMRRHLPGVPTIGVPMTLDKQLAYVLRTYLLGWSNGIRRTYWYDWSSAPLLGIKMVDRHGQTSAAGLAFSRIRQWMSGRVAPCRSTGGRYGLYTCTIDYGQGLRGRVQWSPGHRTTVRAPRGTTGMVNTRGTVRTLKGGARVRLGEAPVLFRYRV